MINKNQNMNNKLMNLIKIKNNKINIWNNMN